MKIVVINGSPKKENSCTLRVTNAFLKGLVGEGDEAETIHLTDCNIRQCLGCLSCWGRTEGTCVIKDDIHMIKEKLLAADTIILSFPLYFFGMPGTFKVFLDRMLSMLCTYEGQLPVPGTSFHGIRPEFIGKKVYVVSTCGYAQTDLIYDPLLAQLDIVFGVGKYTAILCPQGKTLGDAPLHDRTEKFLTKFTAAGAEARETGDVSAETQAMLKKAPFTNTTFQTLLSRFWEQERGSRRDD